MIKPGDPVRARIWINMAAKPGFEGVVRSVKHDTAVVDFGEREGFPNSRNATVILSDREVEKIAAEDL